MSYYDTEVGYAPSGVNRIQRWHSGIFVDAYPCLDIVFEYFVELSRRYLWSTQLVEEEPSMAYR